MRSSFSWHNKISQQNRYHYNHLFFTTTVIYVTAGLTLGEIFSPVKGLDRQTVVGIFPDQATIEHNSTVFLGSYSIHHTRKLN